MRSAPSTTDSELFSALRQGQSSALDALFRRHYVDLCRVALRLLNDEAAAEDVVQVVFTKLWTRRDTLPAHIPAVGPYLRRSVRNRSLNYLRDRSRLPLDDGELPDLPSDPSLQPGAALEAEELQRRLHQAIDRLPERCRLVFVMAKVEEMSHQEIAAGLNISVKTVENQMTRAYKFLRQWLAFILFLIVQNA
ncbi:ECF RNA polymerase sigma factor SigE [Neolewinella maritima]|uniref:ECF RNA polymerase sigma factor SigE n=1 Tax=Neolewinella maritima TaxID=1383882 RepID=A0ABM9AZC5_9BACT|nr:RNA polymerase sigma-70 factor [Neolewinella maritima]CAH1000204.1 ECF RNA polymerase sigma factor SigE [Neolewinella maritima]